MAVLMGFRVGIHVRAPHWIFHAVSFLLVMSEVLEYGMVSICGKFSQPGSIVWAAIHPTSAATAFPRECPEIIAAHGGAMWP